MPSSSILAQSLSSKKKRRNPKQQLVNATNRECNEKAKKKRKMDKTDSKR
jgi:hypothetical protein